MVFHVLLAPNLILWCPELLRVSFLGRQSQSLSICTRRPKTESESLIQTLSFLWNELRNHAWQSGCRSPWPPIGHTIWPSSFKMMIQQCFGNEMIMFLEWGCKVLSLQQINMRMRDKGIMKYSTFFTFQTNSISQATFSHKHYDNKERYTPTIIKSVLIKTSQDVLWISKGDFTFWEIRKTEAKILSKQKLYQRPCQQKK